MINHLLLEKINLKSFDNLHCDIFTFKIPHIKIQCEIFSYAFSNSAKSKKIISLCDYILPLHVFSFEPHDENVATNNKCF